MKNILTKINSYDGLFHSGDPKTGTQGTIVTDTWLNDVQNTLLDFGIELSYVLTQAGLKVDPNDSQQVYKALVQIIENQRPLHSGLALDDETKVATAKAVKTLKDLLDSINRNLTNNYILNSKKSSEINSASADSVATSYAVNQVRLLANQAQTAAENANSNANGRVSKTGDTMTGTLEIKKGNDNSSINQYNTSGKHARIETLPDSNSSFYKFSYRTGNASSSTENYAVTIPKASGAVLLDKDFTNPIFTLTNSNINNLNNLTGVQFLSFGGSAASAVDLPSGLDYTGIQIADKSGQKTQILSAGRNNHYIRIMDDFNTGTWTNEKLLTNLSLSSSTSSTSEATAATSKAVKAAFDKATAATATTRTSKSKTIKGTNSSFDSGTSKSISVEGMVVVYPDGLVEQYFHYKNFRVLWFAQETARATGDRGYSIPVQLWTAMPNKILNVQAQFSRTESTNVTSIRTFVAEAAEWLPPSWAFELQGTTKDKCSLYTKRLIGDSNEAVDLYIKVEGY